jgi:hypothetical protein
MFDAAVRKARRAGCQSIARLQQASDVAVSSKVGVGLSPWVRHESRRFYWWAVTGSNCGPPACKLVSRVLYRLFVPNNFNNLGRLLSLSRQLLTGQYKPF